MTGPEEVPIEQLLSGSLLVTPDPSGVGPLAAQLDFTAMAAVSVTLTVLGAEPLEHRVGATTTHSIPILGLYPATLNRVEVRLDEGVTRFAIDTVEIQTGPLPEFFPTIDVTVADRARMEPGWNLSSLSIGNAGVFESYPIMFDGNGDIRWYLDLSDLGGIVFAVEPLANGNLVTGRGANVYELDRLGHQVRVYPIPGYGFHHEVIEKPDGNLIVAVNKNGSGTREDHVIELDRGSGAVVREWDLREILDVDRFDYQEDPVDWFHMNSIWLDQSDGGLIMSGRNQTAIVKMDEGGELVWILGAHRGWGRAGPDGNGAETSEFLLTAIDADGVPYDDEVQLGNADAGPEFRWPWGQHAAMILPSGNFFLFDNGRRRRFMFDGPFYSRGVEYVVDAAAMTVQQVWQYGEGRGEEFYSAIVSDVDHLPITGNRLILPGFVRIGSPGAYVTEVTYPDGDVVFEARINHKDQLGQGIGFGQNDITYRSERLTPYPGG